MPESVALLVRVGNTSIDGQKVFKVAGAEEQAPGMPEAQGPSRPEDGYGHEIRREATIPADRTRKFPNLWATNREGSLSRVFRRLFTIIRYWKRYCHSFRHP